MININQKKKEDNLMVRHVLAIYKINNPNYINFMVWVEWNAPW